MFKINITQLLILLSFLPIFLNIYFQVYGSFEEYNLAYQKVFINIGAIVFTLLFLINFNQIKRLYFFKIFLITNIFLIIIYSIIYQELNSKYILYFLQILIPWSAFFFGLIYKINDDDIKKIFTLNLILILFLIINSFIQKQLYLTPDFYLFKIYQIYQYVPNALILVFFFSFLLIDFEKNNLLKLFFLTSILIFSLMSNSLSLIFVTCLFVSWLFLIHKKKINLKKIIFVFILFISICAFVFILISFFEQISQPDSNKNFYDWGRYTKFRDLMNLKIPDNIYFRIEIYANFLNVLKNLQIFFIGSNNFDLIYKYKSAHNIILNIIFFKGVFFLLLYFYPFKIFISPFIKKVPIGFVVYLLFLLLIISAENIFKVAIQQPYSGCITMFILGLLKNNYEFFKSKF